MTDHTKKVDTNIYQEDTDGDTTSKETLNITNPLVHRLKWHYELHRRIKLLSWWVKYNIGLTEEAVLKERILKLASDIGFQDRWTSTLIRHAVSEFSKKGLGADYYGYHNIQHELEAAYFTLIAAYDLYKLENSFDQKDLIYLFVAALFHDYDPMKRFDKPHEDSVEMFVRNDKHIKKNILMMLESILILSLY